MLDKFISIIWAIIKNPYEYFSVQMPKDNTVREPLIFAIIITTITSLIYYLGSAITMKYGVALLFLLVFLFPIATILTLYISAFFTQCVIFFFCPQRANFNQTLKVLSYSSAANVFMVFPVIGAFIATIFYIRAVIFGLSAIHNVSALKMFILFIVVPFVLAMILCILIFALFGAALMQLMSQYSII